MRTGRIARKTHETDILVEVNLDGTGAYDVSTGIGFLDHMIEQFSRHSLIDIKCHVQGDLHVDQHHTTEDSAIAIGQAISDALGDKAGIGRYGTAYSPMDEALARVALDISGRPWLWMRFGPALPSGMTTSPPNAAWPLLRCVPRSARVKTRRTMWFWRGCWRT